MLRFDEEDPSGAACSDQHFVFVSVYDYPETSHHSSSRYKAIM